ncbi:aromatic acid exporter family protein [Dactylosporangium sp. CA-139114]|uniref:aromatic acid exporter family protein n=1 Tax=Dactylosporangium sp. CA-139114 TaxID=3239931 RepID=UPI003D97FFD2
MTEPLGTLLASVPQSKPSWLTIVKTTAAATIAWALARQLNQNTAVLFAPVVAVLTLQASVYGSIATGLQLLFANLIGTALAIAWTQLLGLTWWSLALAAFAALAVARQVTNTPLARNQLTIATLVVLVLAPVAHGYGQWRFLDVALGSVVGLTIAVAVPERPRIAKIRATLEAWGRECVSVLRHIADELGTRPDPAARADGPGAPPAGAKPPANGASFPGGAPSVGGTPSAGGAPSADGGGRLLGPTERHDWIAESRKLNDVASAAGAAVAGVEEVALINVFARGLRRDVEQVRREQLWLVRVTLQVRAISLATDRLYDRPGPPPALDRATLRSLINALADLLERRIEGERVNDMSLRAGLIAAVERVHTVFPTAVAVLDSVSLLGRLDQLRQDIMGEGAEALVDLDKVPRNE